MHKCLHDGSHDVYSSVFGTGTARSSSLTPRSPPGEEMFQTRMLQTIDVPNLTRKVAAIAQA